MEMTEGDAAKIWQGGSEAIQVVRQLYADMVKKLDGFEQDANLLLDACEKLPLAWIPVEERLPEENVEVLVSVDENSDDCGYHVCLYRGDEWVRSESGYIFGVTHWMPLPEPPEVK